MNNLYRIDIDESNPEDIDYTLLSKDKIICNIIENENFFNRIIFSKNEFKKYYDDFVIKLINKTITFVWIVEFSFGRILAETPLLSMYDGHLQETYQHYFEKYKSINKDYILIEKSKTGHSVNCDQELITKNDLTFERLDNIFNLQNYKVINLKWYEFFDDIKILATSAIWAEDWEKAEDIKK